MNPAENYISEAILKLNAARVSDSFVRLPKNVQVAVVVSLNELSNQCDGCRRGMPLEDGIHRSDYAYDLMSCTKHRYRFPVKP